MSDRTQCLDSDCKAVGGIIEDAPHLHGHVVKPNCDIEQRKPYDLDPRMFTCYTHTHTFRSATTVRYCPVASEPPFERTVCRCFGNGHDRGAEGCVYVAAPQPGELTVTPGEDMRESGPVETDESSALEFAARHFDAFAAPTIRKTLPALLRAIRSKLLAAPLSDKCPGCENEQCGSALYYANGRFAGCDSLAPALAQQAQSHAIICDVDECIDTSGAHPQPENDNPADYCECGKPGCRYCSTALTPSEEIVAERLGILDLEPDEIDFDAIATRLYAAHEMVRRLCLRRDDPETKDWIMHIPADPKRDPDLVIAAALDDASALLAALRAHRVSTVERDRLVDELERVRTDHICESRSYVAWQFVRPLMTRAAAALRHPTKRDDG